MELHADRQADSMGCGKSKPSEGDKDAAAAAAPAADAEGADATPESPRVIVVVGATGRQGGSVLRALKDDDKFVVKAATRNPDSEKAQELAKQGIELVKLDLDDVESCKEALKGVYGVFLVTDFWATMDGEKETQQGKNVVDAAKENDVKHLVFSGMKSAKEVIGKEGAHHLESKKAVCDYIVEQGVPYTIVDFACYYENLLGALKPTKNDNHEYVLNIPVGNATLDMICISESGEVVHQVFSRPEEFKGQWLTLSSQRFTVEEYATILTKTIDTKKFVAGTMTPEDFGQLGFPGANDLAVMFEFYASGKYGHDIELTRKLHPGIPTFEQWVENNREALEALE